MDPLNSALCLLIGSAIPLAPLFVLVRRGLRQLQVAGAYSDVSRRLGLHVDTRGTSLHGRLGDRRIWIGEVMVGHGTTRRLMTWGVLDLTRPLGLGLLLHRKKRSLLGKNRSPIAVTGDRGLDARLAIQGDDPQRIEALFNEQVRTAIAALMERWPDLTLTDRTVRVHLPTPEANASRLHALVAAMLTLARALEDARRDIDPPPYLDQLNERWEALADRLGLDIEPWLPAASGEIDGRRVLLVPRREPTGYEAELRLWFDTHAETGIQVRRQTDPDGYWSVGQDIQVGDPRFDTTFVIKGWDPQAVVGQLNATAREALLALASVGQPEIDDHSLLVEGLPLEPKALESAVHQAIKTASALGW